MVFGVGVAAHYDDWYRTPEGRRADCREREALTWSLDRFPAAGTALEVGCGTAHFTNWFAARGMDVVGLDLSAEMLAHARPGEQVHLVRGDARRLPFPDDAFDVAALITALEFIDRPRLALTEAMRVARQGVIIGALNRWSPFGLWLKRQAAGAPPPFDAARLYSIAELTSMARSCARDTRPPHRARCHWRSTLLPRWSPLQSGRVPFGGFLVVVVVFDGRGSITSHPDCPAAAVAPGGDPGRGLRSGRKVDRMRGPIGT